MSRVGITPSWALSMLVGLKLHLGTLFSNKMSKISTRLIFLILGPCTYYVTPKLPFFDPTPPYVTKDNTRADPPKVLRNS